MAQTAVITRTKDRPIFLKRAIESVSNQTYRDYVHVIINDGGDKNQVQSVIDGFGEEVTRNILLFHRDKPSEAPDTIFNESIDRVNSLYVAIHDDDDTWHPEFLARMTSHLDKGNQGALARIENIYEEINNKTIKTKKTTRYMPELRAVSLYQQCLDNQLTAVAFVYRRDAYQKVGKYDETLPVVGDWEFGIRFLLHYDVEFVDPGFALAYYHRRIEPDNSFKDHDQRKYMTKTLNKYLRDDISRGKFGIGYIINDLRYQQDMLASLIRKLLPKRVAKFVRKRVR